ncbi:hypothetical protein C7B62_05245 [Pleurocapsa sp. CCALA 161]|uniref:hypothetical protein n=1 Tax=Pleurocapsa sp. CCALA 161 TaxID=2107688 RepID=UPI000D0820B6|nr:hypothetical protein [Pleurocapsa sp. CCALA 161]PSB11540.1 hypothetical protein C7B62_05245 [Pleurocapsa sp. CCALA 161]
MKSAKIVNKILLISLAFGSVTVVAGILLAKENKKALIGLGATASVASIAGMLATSSQKKFNENQEEKQSDNRVTELNSQESILGQSVANEIEETQIPEASVSSFPVEQNQLWDEPVSDLMNEQLETKHELEQQNSFALEDHGQDLETKNNYSNSKLENFSVENEVLEQVISPIEEQSFQETSLESDIFNNELVTAQNSIEEEIEDITGNTSANLNPFANSADLTESSQSEEVADLEIVNKLIGTFEPTEIDTSEDFTNEDSDELFMEESDLEEAEFSSEFSSEFSFDDESPMSSESEDMDFEAMPMADAESIEELATEDESPAEFSFDDSPAIAIEAEFSSEFSFDDESPMSSESEDMDFEAMPMADAESIEELATEDESPAEFSFDDSPAIAIEAEFSSEFSFDDESPMSLESEDMDFEAMPMADAESIEELATEDESPAEFSFDDSPAIAIEAEFSSEFSFDDESPMSSESEDMDFEAMPMADAESDESIEELVTEDESPAEFSFDDSPAIATEAEFSFDDESPMSSESEDMDFEAMPVADADFDDLMGELVVDDQFSSEFNFDDQSDDQSAIATELESNEQEPMEDEQSSMEFSFDDESNMSSESNNIDFEAMLMVDDESTESSVEFSFEDSSAIASNAEEFMGQFVDEDDSSEEINLDNISEMNSESDEFSLNLSDGSEALNAEVLNTSEPNEFMQELVDDHELALNKLTFESEQDLAISEESDSDEFMAAFNNADESFQELSFEEASTEESDFDELMGAFSDESQSSTDQLNNADSDVFDVINAIDKKLDELTEISDDSLGELNDLLGSIQDNFSQKEEELKEINRDK